MTKRGRPRKQGDRNKSDRLRVMVDRGNDKVQARADRFHQCQGGKAQHQVADSIGRAWAAGLLDGETVDPAILRDAGRRYAKLYWHVYGEMAPKMGATERADRGHDDDSRSDPTGERFKIVDDLARGAGCAARDAMILLCVNDWWFPDADSAWLARLLDAALSKGKLAFSPADLTLLRRALHALVSMVEGASDRRMTDIPLHRLTDVA